MNGFLHDSVRPASQRFPGSVLEDGFSIKVSHHHKTESLDTGRLPKKRPSLKEPWGPKRRSDGGRRGKDIG